MSDTSQAFNSKLVFAGSFVEQLVPKYDIKQCDILNAAINGVGNCISKSIIAAIIIERGHFSPVLPALAWNRNTHPKKAVSLVGKTVVQFGHAQLLAANNNAPHTITAVSFNPMGQASDDWELYPFNLDTDIYAAVNDNRIQATTLGTQVGFDIDDWYTGGQRYMEAADIHDSSFHTFTREALVSGVVRALQERNLLSSFDAMSSE